jgi:L-seryl-tRNA(Ser) seleniumtransferase
VGKDLLKELGFRRTLNAAGHVTIYGGSCPAKEVVEAMDRAAGLWIDMRELQKNSGKMLSSYLGCEDGIVTAGAHAANEIAAQTALSLAKDRKRDIEYPNIIVQSCQLSKYAEAYLTGGIVVKEVRRRSKEESLLEHIDRSTVAVAYVLSEASFEFDLKETVDACRKAGVRAIVDAAVVDPVKRGVSEVLAYGPDSVSVSGGKGLNGPNASGLLIGRADFVERARGLAFPNYGPGRAMKVSKEQFVGLMTAVKMAAEVDDQKMIEGWKRRVERIRAGLQGIPRVRTEMLFPWELNFPQPIPRVGIWIETPDGEKRVEEVKRRLLEGNPRILVRHVNDVIKAKNSITLDVRPLRDSEVRIVTESLRATLTAVVR